MKRMFVFLLLLVGLSMFVPGDQAPGDMPTNDLRNVLTIGVKSAQAGQESADCCFHDHNMACCYDMIWDWILGE